MTTPSKRELEHAVRYAQEATKLFMFEWCTTHFPGAFAHAIIETRPATHDDYYVPKSISQQCIVVTRTSFQETGCLLMGCFPFKQGLEPCDATDPVQWVTINQFHSLACQPACFQNEFQVDTEWRKGKCVQANPNKKLFALLPEKLFGETSKHPLHNGLDYTDGTIRLTEDYCDAYGLSFDGQDCTRTMAQKVGEFFLGASVYRKIHQINMKAPQLAQPPAIPNIFKSRTKRSVPPKKPREENGRDEHTNKLAGVIVAEMAADFGIDVSAVVIENLLSKKAPALITKASSNIVYKTALTQAIARTYTSVATQSLQIMGKMVGAAATVLAVYGIATMILDIIDPYKYNYVLDSKTIERLNQELDITFYGREDNFDQELTPEFVWDNVLNSIDDTFCIEYTATKINEYIQALHHDPTPQKLPSIGFQKVVRKKEMRWDNWFQTGIVLMVIVAAVTLFKWIHVWAVALFMVFLFHRRL